MSDAIRAMNNIRIYKQYFLHLSGGLPVIGQTDEGLIRLGNACRAAVMRGKPLSQSEIDDLAANVPDDAEI